MSLYSLSIRRPVLAIVLSLAILLLGYLGFSNLGVREFPSVDPPVITVVTNYRGLVSQARGNTVTIDGTLTVNDVRRATWKTVEKLVTSAGRPAS